MKKLYVFIFVSSLFFSCTMQQKQKVINVKDYGIIANTNQNITSAINKIIEEIDSTGATILFPKGTYHFYPDSAYFKPYFETNTYDVNPKRLAIFLDHKKNITIDAQGSNFVYHDHIQPFTLDNSENIYIKNIQIDWDQPLTAEAEIIEADATHILVKIDKEQFPFTVKNNRLIFAADNWKASWKLSSGSNLIEFDKNHIIPAHTGDHGCVNGDLKNVQYSEPTPGMVLFKGSFSKTPKVGNYIIMRHSTRDHAGMFFYHSKNIKVENVDVYHTSGLGILSQYCENIELQNVNMIPNPYKNRYLSGHDDGLHFMGCKGEIIINNCDAQGLMDDPINIHGTYVPVAKRTNNNTLKCNYAHSMSEQLIWAKKGDTIAFINKSDMLPAGKGIISSFKMENKKTFTLEFQEEIPENISSKFSLENLSWTPNVTITNCFAGSNRARGYLISTPGNVLIENNIFETSGSAILIAGDANYWYESGAVKNINIKNNEFRTPCNSSAYQFCNAIISIYPEIPDANPSLPYHKNITIENNTFNPSDYPIIYAKSVDGLTFKNNTITRSYDYKPWHFQKQNFLFDGCKNVILSGNNIAKDVLGKNILLKNMSINEIQNSNKELTIDLFIK